VISKNGQDSDFVKIAEVFALFTELDFSACQGCTGYRANL